MPECQQRGADIMGLWLLLLLAALVSSSCGAPRSKLTYENLSIKDESGKTLLRMVQHQSSTQSSWKSCKTDGDGLLDCREYADGSRLRIEEEGPLDGDCVEMTATTADVPGVANGKCMELGDALWFGGGEEIPQKWPLNKYVGLNHSMVTQEAKNRGIQDPIWFNSEGMLLYVYPGAPLWVQINDTGNPNQLCVWAQGGPPYRHRPDGFRVRFRTCKFKDAKEAFWEVVRLVGKPTGYPDERMIRHPVWSTWARYKADINETIVRKFAKEIKDNGFENSQLEIDDAWETCYGSKIVDKTRFPNMKGLTDDLKQDGFRVTIWTHPFIQSDCTDTLNEANSKGYLVKAENGTIESHWWNGFASHIDFTNAEAREWFVKKHKDAMEEHGFDGYKFDAGETSWMPQLPVLNISSAVDEDYPNKATLDYVETCAQFNRLTEVRSAYRSQKLSIFLRMIDKDSRWGDDNGLKSLVTTLLQMNMVGYSLVLPDMIGGNQYNGEVADSELFIRWLQANTFMPALQYALVPWDYNDNGKTVEISKKFNKLHADFTDIIIAAFKKNVMDGSPVNPPIWWLDPTDKMALQEDSEYLLGEDVLVAPVLERRARTRAVYLPKGKWRDANTKEVYTGPITIWQYPAPLDTLPWFVIVDSPADKLVNGSPASAASLVLVLASVLSYALRTAL